MADDSFEEPFDSAPPSARLQSTTTPNAPPSFAFGHSTNMSSIPVSVPPPVAPSNGEDEWGTKPVVRTGGMEPSVVSPDLSERSRKEERTSPTQNFSSSQPADSELGARQPYSFRQNSNYDTADLIRKYGGIAGVLPSPHTVPPSPRTIPPSSPADVRDRAQKMLELVDDYAIRRSESGGIRAAPVVHDDDDGDEAFSFRRKSSGKRVPSALSGLSLSTPTTNSWKDQSSGRASFSGPSFHDDDQMSDDEDRIHLADGTFHDEPVVDVVGMENRAAGMRAYSDDKTFAGDFHGGSKTWSSRYTDNPYIARAHVLEKWDREFEQEKGRKSARNMFMSTASDIRSSASNVLKEASSQKDKIFGTGGFSFRATHVFGNHRSASERDEVNLRTAWREVEDDPITLPGPHKTWQEVILNKRKRRRIVCGILLIIFGSFAAVASVTAVKNAQERAAAEGSNIGQSVTFYVTSDSPYDAAAEERLEKDLINIPMDSEFVVHLGNIQDAAVSMCPRNRYADVASVLQKSPVPLFIIPGAEDWAKCPNPAERMDNWLHTFKDFDLRFKHSLDVKRDSLYPEAFSFLHKGVLFMGVHIVSGPVLDDQAWQEREKQMLKFYFGMANANKGAFRSIVLMGNARPSPQQKDFFNALLSNLKGHHGGLLYIHANQKGDEVHQYNPFSNHTDVAVIGVQDGSQQPPLKITVGFGDRPLIVG
jgi:hypothetical protein